MMENRLVAFMKPVLIWSALALALLAVVAGFAHATVVMDGTPAPVIVKPVPVDQGLPIAAWILGGLGALAGIDRLVRALADLLGIIAKRTPNTMDDAVHAKLDKLADGLDEVVAVVRGVVPSGPARDAQSGRVGLWPMIILAGSAIGIASQAMWFTGCAETKRGAAAAKVAALECGKPQLATAAAIVARWAVDDALAGEIQWAKHEADALGFGLGVGTCAYAELRAAYRAKPTPQALALGSPPDDGQAGLERLRAKLGGAKIILTDGSES